MFESIIFLAQPPAAVYIRPWIRSALEKTGAKKGKYFNPVCQILETDGGVSTLTAELDSNHMANYIPINFSRKLSKFGDQWSPKIIAEMNDYQFKLVKIQGDFVWHAHRDTDEAFIALDGQLTIEFRDGMVKLSAGEMFVVPKGVEHKPISEQECHLLLVEPRGVVNTGDVNDEKTADNDVWI
ncbi:MAG: cupin domain-containing protein [Phycisphaerales bacterium]|nr:MAG: cupin domain-containing protein [Phycisphaerales bacterium]